MEIQVWVGIAGVLIGASLSFLTFNRNRDKDVRSDASEFAVIKTTLANINSGVDSIRVDIKANERRVTELSEKVIIVNESTKQAHKRIDEIVKKGGNSE